MPQQLLRISLPSGVRLYPSRFRELLAKLPGLPNQLFHRNDEAQTINTKPPVRTVGGAGWVGIVADPGAHDLLQLAIGPAIMAVTTEVGLPCPVQIQQLKFGLKAIDHAKEYFLREVVVKKGLHKYADQHAVLEKRITQSIEEICAANGFDCPPADMLGVMVTEVIGLKGLRLQTTDGVTNQWVGMASVKFMINAELDGMWCLGNLTSRGYGRIVNWHPGMNTRLEHKGDVLK